MKHLGLPLLAVFALTHAACRSSPGVSPAFTEEVRNTRRAPFVVLTSEGLKWHADSRTRPVPGGAGADTFCWDANGAALYVTKRGGLHRLPWGEPLLHTIVAGFSDLRFPDVSPDGDRIAFAARATESDPWKVYVVQADGTGLTPIAEGYDPCWSHDATRLYFENFVPRPDVFTFTFASGAVEAVFPAGHRHTVEASEDGRYLAYTSGGRLHLVGVEGELVTGAEGDYDRFPSFAPDGKSVLFFRQPRDDSPNVLIELDLASGEERVLPVSDPRLGVYRPLPLLE